MVRKKTTSTIPALPNSNILAPNVRPDPNRPVDTSGAYPQAQTPFPAAAGAQSAGPNGTSVFANPGDETENDAFKTGAPMNLDSKGNSGTQIFGGYFSEEYLSNLRGRRAAQQWDEMRRSESQISMLMNAIINPIKAANWDFEPYDANDPECVKHCELVKHCMLDMIDFDTFKGEALTMIPFGFSLMEVVHSVTFDDEKFGTFNGLKALSFRAQKTIENWQLEPKTGRLVGVNQYTYSDLGGNQFIPGEFLLCFTLNKEGDNYEGISALRPMLGAYKRKELYLQLAAIGVERYAIGTPIGTVPAGKEKSPEYQSFLKTLQNYTSHEASYITVPQGWTIDVKQNDFDASKIKELIVMENTEFANAVVANFLVLGLHGSGSSLALGSNLLEFFTTGIQAYADLVCSTINRNLSPNLVKMNFGPQRGYPKMRVSGISDKAGKELAETIKFLADSRALDPDMPLKQWLRKMYKMPKADPNSAVALPAIPSGATTNYPKPNDPVVDPKTGKIKPFSPQQLLSEQLTYKLADPKYVKQFDSNKAQLKAVMQVNLLSMYQALKNQLRTRYKSLPASQKVLTAKGCELPGLMQYKQVLRDQLASYARQSQLAANKSLPKALKLKLAESDFDALSPKVRALINAQSDLVAETQAADIEKITFFQFTSDATTTDDIDAILSSVDEKVLDTIDGSTAGGMSIDVAAADALAHVVQQSSLSVFFDDDVIDGIESFTFTNEDPVSECCQALAGQTFSPNDPDLDAYTPPLHHNCKSRLVANYKGDDGNPDVDRGVAISQKALDSITLGEFRHIGRRKKR